MAKLIEFYVPDGMKTIAKWVSREARGKMIPFPVVENQRSETSPAADSVVHN